MSFITDSATYNGGRLSDRVFCVRADNPSPMTYMGTNTWIIAEPDCPECVVVDPAPSGVHVENVLNECVGQGLRVGAIVLTHCHADHTEGADDLESMTGAQVYSREDGSLVDGVFEPIDGGPVFRVVPLPGHSADSVGLVYPQDHSMITGDVVFRHGPTVVYHPDGVLQDYMDSLDVLQKIVEEEGIDTFLPGHGYPITDPVACIEATREHRLERLAQIRQALAAGVARDADALVDAVYTDIDSRLRPAALRSVQAQLVYLENMGE